MSSASWKVKLPIRYPSYLGPKESFAALISIYLDLEWYVSFILTRLSSLLFSLSFFPFVFLALVIFVLFNVTSISLR
jgi:hypothetical protein